MPTSRFQIVFSERDMELPWPEELDYYIGWRRSFSPECLQTDVLLRTISIYLVYHNYEGINSVYSPG